MTRRVGVGVLIAAAVAAGPGRAAPPQEVDAAVRRGVEFLKSCSTADGSYGSGRVALIGLALLEAGVPPNHPTVVAAGKSVRTLAASRAMTYDVATAILFLDRLGDREDVPLVQMLGLRLLKAQSAVTGGWGYASIIFPQEEKDRVTKLVEARAFAGSAGTQPPRLHPEALRHAQTLIAPNENEIGPDNSNTQFAVLALWVARRHAVPAEPALAAAERRFILSQNPNGGWGYRPAEGSTPAMTCAGLLALTVGRAIETDKRAVTLKGQTGKDAPPGKTKDSVFTPPAPKPNTAPKPGGDPRSAAAAAAAGRGFEFLGQMLKGTIAAPKDGWHPEYDIIYALWSMERAAVVYKLEKVGGVDWYQVGSDHLVKAQQGNGAWASKYGEDIGTSLAVLFLLKSNLAKDLNGGLDTELRSGAAKGADPPPAPKATGELATADAAALKLAVETLKLSGAAWTAALAKLKDEKGTTYTQALAVVAGKAEGTHKKEARDALADRLTRMTAGTLRTLLADPDTELRRGAALACAMKDDKAHVPDLIGRITDADDAVTQAAKAALKSLTGQDHGPPAGATAAQKQTAAAAWKAWLATQPK